MLRLVSTHRLARSAGRNYVCDHHQVQEALSNALNEQLREEYCETMIEKVPLHRDLIAAWTVASPGIPVRYLKRRG